MDIEGDTSTDMDTGTDTDTGTGTVGTHDTDMGTNMGYRHGTPTWTRDTDMDTDTSHGHGLKTKKLRVCQSFSDRQTKLRLSTAQTVDRRTNRELGYLSLSMGLLELSIAVTFDAFLIGF